VFISATFVFNALALTLEARKHAERSHASAFANKYETNFTAKVKSNFLPCWAAKHCRKISSALQSALVAVF
jgi:hypothetical protein